MISMRIGLSLRRSPSSLLLLALLVAHFTDDPPVALALSNPVRVVAATESAGAKNGGGNGGPRPPTRCSFSVPLANEKPRPETLLGRLGELWNDPRPVGSAIRDSRGGRESETATDDGNGVGGGEGELSTPYCIASNEFDIGSERFQIFLYPRGRFAGGGKSSGSDGIASAYLRYLPRERGDEIDVAWTLRLVDGRTGASLPVGTSGGLPRSDVAWSSALTFCDESEAVESVGRTQDWGSSTWSADDVCAALLGNDDDDGRLRAEGEATVFEVRNRERSLALEWPPFARGAIGATRRSSADAARTMEGDERDFRAGEVIVPTNGPNANPLVMDDLQRSFVYPGIDYRIMTISDGDGNPIFSTADLPEEERGRARLALRPCGWKLQRQLFKKNGMVGDDWPVEVEAGKLSRVALTRFNPRSALPRIIGALERDRVAYASALAIAVSPIPLALLLRTAVSLYVIPSASMEPTLLRGDTLLVEKLPGAYSRTKRGDVVLFRPPSALRDIVTSNGSQLPGTSLFVKRVVGMPGDKNIKLVLNGDVTVNGEPTAGPDRTLCADEPLRLIDRLLENGKGRSVEELGSDEVYVLGDCKAVSIDSRVFGTLPTNDIVGKPIARIWPLSRFKISGHF